MMGSMANPTQFGAPLDSDAAYMEQEDEWEREGLLDPAWEKQQRKVNHRWTARLNMDCNCFFYYFSLKS